MKVVAFNGSARKDGNTAILIRYALKELENEGIDTELVQLAGRRLRGCTACMKCFETRDQRCIIKNDIVNRCIQKMIGADGIILGSPVYFLDVSPEMKALIDRCGFVSMANGGLYRRKVGSVVVAVRRTGASRTADTMMHFLLAGDMIIPGFPGIGVGRNIGDVEDDAEGIERVKNLGRNMAWLLRTLETAGRQPEPILAKEA